VARNLFRGQATAGGTFISDSNGFDRAFLAGSNLFGGTLKASHHGKPYLDEIKTVKKTLVKMKRNKSQEKIQELNYKLTNQEHKKKKLQHQNF
jgi:hypothetical protein